MQILNLLMTRNAMHCRVLLIVIPVIYDIMSGGLSLRQCADQ